MMYSQEQLDNASIKADQVGAAVVKFTENLFKGNGIGKEYKILIAAPWSETGWKQYSLLREDSRKLNRIIRRRQDHWTSNQLAPLYAYDHGTRYWYINIYDYKNLEEAKNYLLRFPVTIREWLKAEELLRQKEPV